MTRIETFQCPACHEPLLADVEDVPHPDFCMGAGCPGGTAGLDHNVRRVQLRPHDCGLVTTMWADRPGTVESAAAAAHEQFWARPQESKILSCAENF